jgi:predicted transcriptional regulator
MGYTPGVAKVLISLPDDVLRGLDEHARDRGASRSGLLRELIERELEAEAASRQGDIRRLLARPGRRGASGTAAVRKARRSR